MSTDNSVYNFNSWYREGMAEDIIAPEGNETHARIEVSTEIGRDTVAGGKSTLEYDRAIPMLGAGEVTAINPRQIVRTWPAHATADFPKEYMPFIEFHDEDFLWRYSPEPTSPAALGPADSITPWLTLVCLEEGEYAPFTERLINGANVLEINEEVKLPDLNDAWRWAHVHINDLPVKKEGDSVDPDFRSFLKENPLKGQCRLIMPINFRTIEFKNFRCFLVPTYERGRIAGLGGPNTGDALQSIPATQFSWTGQVVSNLQLPVYQAWSFTIDSEGDFETLCEKLGAPNGGDAPKGFQTVTSNPDALQIRDIIPSTLNRTSLDPDFRVGAALAPISKSGPSGIAVSDFDDAHLEKSKLRTITENARDLNALEDDENEVPMVLPPAYGQYYCDRAENPLWFTQLNHNRAYRAAAGVGTSSIQKNQEVLMENAWKVVGSIYEQNEYKKGLRAASLIQDTLHEKRFNLLELNSSTINRAEIAEMVGFAGNMETLSEVNVFKNSTVPNVLGDRVFRHRLNTQLKRSSEGAAGSYGDIFVAPREIDTTLEQSASATEMKKAYDVKLQSMTNSAPYVFGMAATSGNQLDHLSVKISRMYKASGDARVAAYLDLFTFRYRGLRGASALSRLKAEKYAHYTNIVRVVNARIAQRSLTCILGGLRVTGVSFDRRGLWKSVRDAQWSGFFNVRNSEGVGGIHTIGALVSEIKNRGLFFLDNDALLKDFIVQVGITYSKSSKRVIDFKNPDVQDRASGTASQSSGYDVFRAMGPQMSNDLLMRLREQFETIIGEISGDFSSINYALSHEALYNKSLNATKVSSNKRETSVYISTSTVQEEAKIDRSFYCELLKTFGVVYFLNKTNIETVTINSVLTVRKKYDIAIELLMNNVKTLTVPGDGTSLILGLNKTFFKQNFANTGVAYKYGTSLVLTSEVTLAKLDPKLIINKAKKLASLQNILNYGRGMETLFESIKPKEFKAPINLGALVSIKNKLLSAESLKPITDNVLNVNASLLEQSIQKNTMAAPTFKIPAVNYLLEQSSDYLLPGIETLPDNTVLLLQTNKPFIESYLVGLNHEMGRELLWREYPTDMRGSYFLTFWDKQGTVQLEESADVTPLDEWSDKIDTHGRSNGYRRGLKEQRLRRERIQWLRDKGYDKEAFELEVEFNHRSIAQREIELEFRNGGGHTDPLPEMYDCEIYIGGELQMEQVIATPQVNLQGLPKDELIQAVRVEIRKGIVEGVIIENVNTNLYNMVLPAVAGMHLFAPPPPISPNMSQPSPTGSMNRFRMSRNFGIAHNPLHTDVSNATAIGFGSGTPTQKFTAQPHLINAYKEELLTASTTKGLGAHGRNNTSGRTVLLIKSRLLEKYPNTLVYAMKGYESNGSESIGDRHQERFLPSFTGTLPGGISWFGFDIDSKDLVKENEKWAFALQERPGEFNFDSEGFKAHSNNERSAEIAKSHLNKPIIYVFTAEELLEGGE
ncbi:MAG: hypothetical protein OCC49_15325 [Fibrobacterales bacterium]